MQDAAVAGCSIPTFFLREVFLQMLLHNLRMVLASTPDSTTLDKLAETADKNMEVAAPSVASLPTLSTQHTDSLPSLAAEVASLCADVSRLEKLVQK